MIKILIVGSKGFIGSHAYHYFTSLSSKYDCKGCDVMVDYNDRNYQQLDISNSDYANLFEQVKFDVCINCSGAASVPDSIVHPLRDFTLNVFNVVKILDAIKRYAPNCKFINLSSAAVYGNPKQLPISELDVCNPVSPYGIHKQMAEQICTEYATFFGLQICSARIFSAYGPGLKKQLLWDIYQKSKHSKSITLYGTGNESRDFIYVVDIISALELLITKARFVGDVFNIANGIEVSVRELAETILNHLDFKGDLIFNGEFRKGDPIHWRADISKLQATGYKYEIDIEQGVDKYIKWLKEEE